MKNKNKKQEDRLLKQLPLKERRQQEQLRRLILNEQIFKSV